MNESVLEVNAKRNVTHRPRENTKSGLISIGTNELEDDMTAHDLPISRTKWCIFGGFALRASVGDLVSLSVTKSSATRSQGASVVLSNQTRILELTPLRFWDRIHTDPRLDIARILDFGHTSSFDRTNESSLFAFLHHPRCTKRFFLNHSPVVRYVDAALKPGN